MAAKNILMPRYKLRTLLIVLALGPPVLAGGYWLWDRLRPKPSLWYIQDGGYYFPPGPDWKLSREAAAMKQFKADTKRTQQH